MNRVLKFSLIGCGGLVGLVVLLGIIGALVGGGEPATEPAPQQVENAGAKEEAAQAKRETEEAEAAKARAEEEPAPQDERGSGTATIRVTGVDGEQFTGSYGNLDTTQSVDGTLPAEYEVEVDTGFMSLDSVTAVMQKASAGANPLKVEILVDGEVVKETSTTAEYGVATVTWSPSE